MMSKATAILGLGPEPSVAEIKSTFRELSLVHHPDVGGDAEKFRVLHDAYTTALEEASDRPCVECGGTGKITVQRAWQVTRVTCTACSGTGYPS
jgi:DnaJ-class molecular chaperone